MIKSVEPLVAKLEIILLALYEPLALLRLEVSELHARAARRLTRVCILHHRAKCLLRMSKRDSILEARVHIIVREIVRAPIFARAEIPLRC